jgi:NAD(P)-dependent dehydrogenase (short-subunit alcohol dehydrogenase family)
MNIGRVVPGGLEGMGALVTGGGSGIGLGCAKRLAADGASVTICGRTEERLRGAVEEIEAVAASGASVQFVVADVTDEEQVIAAVAKSTEPTGGLQAVIASAGGSTSIGPVTQIDVQPWRDTLELNVTGTMLTLKHSARVMVRCGGGSFVGISSIAASNTHRWFAAYGVAKAGIDHLCELAADELGASNVRVNCIRPGLIRTEIVEAITEGGPVLDDYFDCMPIARVGEPEDVAALARFLVGPDSAWITGMLINVDGGQHLRRGPIYRAFLEPIFGADGLRGVV